MAVALIFFLIVSPGFRKAVALTSVGLSALTWWWIYHPEEASRKPLSMPLPMPLPLPQPRPLHRPQPQPLPLPQPQPLPLPQPQQQQSEASQTLAATVIKPSDLALEDVAFVKPSYCLGMESSSICISDWILKGLVTNNSNYALAWMTFEIKAVDCPVQSTVAVTHAPSRKCRIVGQVRREAPTSVPPGQTGEFSSYDIKFEGIPPKDLGFQRTFSWTLIKASLGFQAP